FGVESSGSNESDNSSGNTNSTESLTPQQNGVAERKNMTLIEAARTMLADSLLPIQFWAEAVNTACYVLNRVLVTKPQMKTPYEILMGRSPNIRKDKEGEDVDVHLYRSMIGCLMYLTASRPDIMFAVCLCARFQVTPKVSHMHAVKRIFRYLKHQPKLGLWYPKDSPFHLEAFSDSDYAGDNHDRRSTSGGCQYLERRLQKIRDLQLCIVGDDYISTSGEALAL
ncbi:uncharacterized mitochondrial protein-like protein, partial [Tanacetum coccineum]